MVNHREDRTILPRLPLPIMQRLPVDAEHPTVSKEKELLDLHWGDRVAIVDTGLDKFVGNCTGVMTSEHGCTYIARSPPEHS